MKTNVRWNPEKEEILQEDTTRSCVSFTDCVVAMEEGNVLYDGPHPTRPGQGIMVLCIENYAYVVPYVEEADGTLFLKTVFPSRKHTALYLK
jgi:hypothetical protein